MAFIELLVVGGFGLFLGTRIRPSLKNQRKVTAKAENLKLPFDLGLRNDCEYSNFLNDLRIKLEDSLDPVYLENVKKRVMEKCSWSEAEFAVYLYGVKQFFLLNAVLKSVPMYSKEVDEIWHEMLMFTREYQAFCQQFIGEMIHHEPNISEITSEVEVARAEFDWLYSQFFEINEVNKFIYNGFYQFKLAENRIHELEKMTLAEIQSFFFKKNQMVVAISESVAGKLKMQVEQVKLLKAEKSQIKPSSNDGDNVLYSLFSDEAQDHTDQTGAHHNNGSHHHTNIHHHSCSSHSCSSHSCSSCSSCSS
ncbi:hypothetical protein HPT25_22235 [Bacillus sp. BRMEA1]|uniref:hypothetical protein n=1 Tax=Neobacillus endophyticus TaxID=2738405 RepID=UPI001563313E|nr:hypothetical protein [Neobacillus endophyticus]NRD80060.1 hypothetical protein [Neobacillus endophyticus]